MSQRSDDARRLQNEAAFHDAAFGAGGRQEVAKFYSVARRSDEHYRARVMALVRGKRVLEYGCGPGSSAFDICRTATSVVGIDISQVGIDQATMKAKELGLTNADFRVMDAENLQFPDRSLDVVVGSGILHHLDIPQAFREVTRVLTPGGTAIFLEPLGHNPLINWYRGRTPHLRTIDEHPLRVRDIALAEHLFSTVRARYFHLFALGLVPLSNSRIFEPLYSAAERLDGVLWTLIPPARRLAWCVVIECTDRRSTAEERQR